MEDTRHACEVGVKLEIEFANKYCKYAHLMPLHYTIYFIKGSS